jgi:hypothetical protein
MTESERPGQPAPTEEEMRQLWPTVLELQRVLVERLRGTARLRPPDEVAAISFTSCDHHSCQ